MADIIDLTINKEQQKINAKICKEKGIILPTYEEMRNPETIAPEIKEALKGIDSEDLNSKNLFRVTWQNEVGGAHGDVNYIQIPSALTGVEANVLALVGKYFPTGAHKVGAAYSCIAYTLASGQFKPDSSKAVWPSTGNYCRGGAYISRLLGCKSIAILPEDMSKERFDWLEKVADQTIATPGCESNVKEIFDKCWELKESGEDLFIFNQFEQLANHLWHHEVTGHAMSKVLEKVMGPEDRFAGTCVTSGSAGTMASGERLKEIYPKAKLCVGEALQCSTLVNNGFGGHRIEGIGDKHVPWIHNVKNTDAVCAIDDEMNMRILRLFNEKVGQDYLIKKGVPAEFIEQIGLMGISGIANMMCCIKFAKYYELTGKDYLFTVCTDSAAMYQSRLVEETEARGEYTLEDAAADFEALQQVSTEHFLELTYAERKRVHNLKYYTWVEQQQRDVEDLNDQWYDDNYWTNIYKQGEEINQLIKDFNEMIKNS